MERLGRYELLRRIAVGGMAEIFVAREVGLAGFERPAIVKRILPAFAEDEKFVSLFLDEARVAAQLAHPNVAHIYELGYEGGSYFIAMELVQGCDLQSLLSAAPGPTPLPLDEAVYVASEVLEGLQHAHSLRGSRGVPLGIVHRDVAPKNVLVSLEGAVKIVDFGIAKARNKVSVTAPGLIMGTYNYMSPEQARAGVVDHRTDVFATGAMLYRMTTGRDAYRGSEVIDVIEAAQRGEFPEPRQVHPGIPDLLEAVILRAMAVHPDDRYPSAAHMRRDLGVVSRELGLEGDPDSLAALVRTRMPHLEGLVRSWLAPALGIAAGPKLAPPPAGPERLVLAGLAPGGEPDEFDERTTQDLSGRLGSTDLEDDELRDTWPMDADELPFDRSALTAWRTPTSERAAYPTVRVEDEPRPLPRVEALPGRQEVHDPVSPDDEPTVVDTEPGGDGSGS